MHPLGEDERSEHPVVRIEMPMRDASYLLHAVSCMGISMRSTPVLKPQSPAPRHPKRMNPHRRDPPPGLPAHTGNVPHKDGKRGRSAALLHTARHIPLFVLGRRCLALTHPQPIR